MMTALVIHFVMSQQKSVMLVVKGGTYPRTAPIAMREAKGATTVASLATSLVIAPMKQVSPKTIHVSSAMEVLWDFHLLFGSRNSATTGILPAIRHVYRSEKLSLALT